MKKILFGLSAFTMLFATSCQNDLDFDTAVGETSTVSFSVGTPEIATRAYSDGATATKLQYAVYDAEGKILSDLTETDATINGSTTVKLQLTTGNTYKVIFWAAAPNAPYTVDFDAKTMTVDYSAAVSNDEARDAFYKYHTFTVKGAQTETIELKRPFAQLNIGTADYTASESAGYVPTQSAVVVKNVYNTLNLATGVVENEVEANFALANIKKDETFPVKGYEYLAMNYLLVSADKTVVDVEFTYTDGSNAKTRTVGSVPVQRNYRTNIYGNLLTSDVDVNVVIKPEYDGEFDNEGYFVEEDANGNIIAVVESANGLATVANAIADSTLPTDIDVVLEGDIDLAELAAATRSAVVSNWTPIGTSEKPYTGTFDGKGYTIKNLTLVEQEAKEGKAYIGFFGYAKDATIKNVTFENVYINIPCLDIDHSQGHIGAVAGSLEGTSTIENVTVKGDIKVEATQTANGASRVAVVAGGNSYGNVTIKNVHVIANEGSYLIANNNTGAIAGQLQGKTHYENCSSNIDVTVNKFFAGGIVGLAGTNDTFINCHTTGNIAVVAGREGKAHDHYRVGGIAGGWADGKNNVCTLEGCSYTGTLTGINADGSVAEVFDYMGYVGRGYTLNGCQGSKVIIDGTEFVQKYNTAAQAGIYTINGCTPVATADELIAALAAGEGVYLLNDIVYNGTIVISKGMNAVIDLGGKTLSATDETSVNYELINNAGTLLVKNGTMKVMATINSGWNRYSAVIANTVGGNLTVNNVNIEHLGGTDMAYGIDNLTNGKGTYAVTTIENANIKSTYRAVRQFLNGTEATNELYVKAGSVLEGPNKSIFFHDPSKSANSGKLVVEEGAQLKGDVYLYVTAGSTEWPVEVSVAASALVGESKVTSGNVPQDYAVQLVNGIWTVVK